MLMRGIKVYATFLDVFCRTFLSRSWYSACSHSAIGGDTAAPKHIASSRCAPLHGFDQDLPLFK